MSDDKRGFNIDSLQEIDGAFVAFLLAFTVGSAVVVLSKSFGWPLFLVVSLPVVVMFAYWLASMVLPGLSVRKDQLGDNMYYLGFLLTLVSLTVTLVQYSTNSDNNYIISNFGVALVATLVGILARTLHSQMRKDVAGVERDLQEQLSQASYRLRGQIGAVSEDFAVLSRQITQITRQYSQDIVSSHKALSGGLVKVVDEQTGALKVSSETSSKRIEAAIDNTVSKLEAAANDGSRQMIESATSVKGSIDETARSFGEYLEHHTHTLRTVQEREANERQIQMSELKAVIKQLTNAVVDVNSEAITRDQLNRFTEAFEVAALEVTEVMRSVSEASASSEARIKQLSEDLSAALQASDKTLSRVVEAVDSFEERLDRHEQPVGSSGGQSAPPASSSALANEDLAGTMGEDSFSDRADRDLETGAPKNTDRAD